MELIIPTARSKLHCLLMAIVMGREESKAFMWSAMSLKENKPVQFLYIYILKRREGESVQGINLCYWGFTGNSPYQACFVFWRSRIQISSLRPTVLIEVFRDFPHFIQENFVILLQIRLQTILPFHACSVNHKYTCRIWGSHSGDHEAAYFLRYNVV
jgi:hypothetical protein